MSLYDPILELDIPKLEDDPKYKAGQQSMQSKIEQLEKKLNAVTNLLNDLKAGIKDFRELDLYDKGYRVTTEYIIQDLEKALRGES